ncbi:MAG: precorrin-6y C5,15-methyltransferase (decarboxylating) subunit CbiE [Tissierellia bacterium]|nr:precorrin-6y C5,15-methyltransferase (decarboxylating) subunit CbiE [Tissierellia bacterium]
MLAGVGPGHPRLLTQEVRELIESSSRVLAFGRVARGLGELRSDIETIKKVEDAALLVKEDQDILILASGDPCFYGLLEFLQRKEIVIDRVLPGLSSFQYLCSKLQKPWQQASLLSLHGREESLESVGKSRLSIILVDGKNTPQVISKRLFELGVRGKLYVGFNLSYEDELIVRGRVGEDIENYSSLAVMVVENEVS